MALSSLIEEMLALPKSPASNAPGKLLYKIALNYYTPFFPPNQRASFVATTTPVAGQGVGSGICHIFYRLDFGALEPGSFQFRAVLGGQEIADEVIDGNIIENGFDYLYFQTRDDSLVAYVTNLSNRTQHFSMFSHYLVLPTVEDWDFLKKWLKAKNIDAYNLDNY